MARYWQSWMIALARSPRVTRWVQGNRATASLARRFVGGDDVGAALRVAGELQRAGFKTSLYYLGEYVEDPELIAENGRQKIAIAEALDTAQIAIHVSFDASQLGYAVDDKAGAKLALRIGERIRALGERSGRPPILMLNMEDAGYVDRILELRQRLIEAGVPVAQTLQAYLKRSAADLARIIAAGGTVRLVKGAFADSGAHAFQGAAIDANYLKLAGMMLAPDAKARGFRPIFGTHDHALIPQIRALAQRNGWRPGAYEFEMLYGVRPALQRELRASGEQVRLYVPFGRAWWPYAVRRVGESPRNFMLLARTLIGA